METVLLNLAVALLTAFSQRLFQVMDYYSRERKAKAIKAEKDAGITAEDHNNDRP